MSDHFLTNLTIQNYKGIRNCELTNAQHGVAYFKHLDMHADVIPISAIRGFYVGNF